MPGSTLVARGRTSHVPKDLNLSSDAELRRGWKSWPTSTISLHLKDRNQESEFGQHLRGPSRESISALSGRVSPSIQCPEGHTWRHHGAAYHRIYKPTSNASTAKFESKARCKKGQIISYKGSVTGMAMIRCSSLHLPIMHCRGRELPLGLDDLLSLSFCSGRGHKGLHDLTFA